MRFVVCFLAIRFVSSNLNVVKTSEKITGFVSREINTCFATYHMRFELNNDACDKTIFTICTHQIHVCTDVRTVRCTQVSRMCIFVTMAEKGFYF